jgi:hypothetical protein
MGLWTYSRIAGGQGSRHRNIKSISKELEQNDH